MKHYVYRITNTEIGKHYYGVRSATNPSADLGVKYFSSSSDKKFIAEQKEYPQKFKYKIIKIFKERSQALEFEIKLHKKFNVAVNNNFYNKAQQTSYGFDRTGIPKSKKFKILNSLLHKNKKVSEETRNKISQKTKELWENFEYREKQKQNRPNQKGILNHNIKPVTIYKPYNTPFLTVLFDLKTSLDEIGFPGISFFISLYSQKRLFQSNRKGDITKIKNKGFYHFKGWYAKHSPNF